LKRVLISDSEAKVAQLVAPTAKDHIVVEDEPTLNTKAFADLVTPFIGQTVTAQLVEHLVDGITAFVKQQGQPLVYVTVPQQNVADGSLRVVVILGRYNLTRLLISDSEAKAAALRAAPDAGQIVLQDEPVLATSAFAARLAPLFGCPITDDALSTLIAACSAYAREHHAVLASVQVPDHQSIKEGELRLAVILGSYPLQRIIISDTKAAADAAQPPAGAAPIVVDHSPLFATPEFARLAGKYLGRPITPELVQALKQDIIAYGRSHDRLLVDVPVPAEDLSRGELRLAVLIGHYNQLVFKGNRWFSNDLLARKLGVKPGDEVRASTLESAVDWANQNPFRQVQVLINTVNKGPDVAELDVAVQEHRPFRFAASYDDSGTQILGNNHYTGSLQFGNLWGLDHQASYQFTTTEQSHIYQAHALDYRIPLPWHSYLQFDAAYSVVRPGGLFGIQGVNESGHNEVADLKYVAPLKLAEWSIEPSLGVDYKQVNTNLEFFDFVQPVATYDVGQLTSGLTAVHRDHLGSWTFAANVDYSPGGLNSRDNDTEYNTPATGRESRYVYGSVVAQRATILPDDFQWISRGQIQVASTNLQGSEELTVGGAATVRGYNERIFSGDQGWVVNQELRGPDWRWHVPFLRKNAAPLEMRPLLFWDYARVTYKHDSAAEAPLDPIMSTGCGIRSNLSSNFSVSADFGWQILATTFPQPNHDRGDIQVTLAY
jgi:hemolysin activation/secretion protein